MAYTEVIPVLSFGDVDQKFSRLSLTAKSQLLRDKIKLLRQSTKTPQETLHHIESHLNAISQEANLMGQWSHYELAYEGFISAGSLDDLLGVVLSLRSCASILDAPTREIWSNQKLDRIEQDVRSGNANGTVREEIASLARAIYEAGFRFVRKADLKSRVMRTALLFNAALSALVIAGLWFLQMKRIGPESAWQVAVIACLGASGALLHATLQLRQSRMDVEDLRIEPMVLLFRATFGAILGVVVILFLRLRVIDFPYLHTSTAASAPFAPAALYVFAFASGFAAEIIFSTAEEAVRRRSKRQEKRQIDWE